MSEETNFSIRLSKAAKEFNVGKDTIVEFLGKKGFQVDPSPNTKLTSEMYELLVKEYQGEKEVKNEAKKLGNLSYKGGSVSVDSALQSQKSVEEEDHDEVIIRTNTISTPVKKSGKSHAASEPAKEKETSKEEKPVAKEPAAQPKKEVEKGEQGVPGISLKIVGQIDLEKKPKQEKKPKSEPEKPAKPQEKQPEAEVKKPEEVKKAPVEAAPAQKEQPAEEKLAEPRHIKLEAPKLTGPTVLGTLELPVEKKNGKAETKKKKRKRIMGKPEGSSEDPTGANVNNGGKKQEGQKPGKGPRPADQGAKKGPKDSPKLGKKDKKGKREEKPELSEEEISKQIKDTLARLAPMGKSKTSKHRREKRQQVAGSMMEEMMRQEEDKKVLKVTEFVTANELATMMNVPVVKVIGTCMSLGMPVSINQRLDAEALTVVAEEFGFQVDFVSADVQEAIAETDEVDKEEDLVPRAPVVTVMGHVDHGKTKLLDYIRNTNVVAGEAGGITQHIGAYEVTTESGKKITFLDTPGHEAFTAMRARGAKITDVAIIVIATDDSVMPQTVEAINHAQAAGVPIVFALNKIDKPTANPDKIREQLANMNILVESWGGKYQDQEIAAKIGLNVDALLEKVLLEAELLDLKANPNRLAKGTVIESALDKGRGYVAKILVQNGTLKIGDMVLAGTTYGKVKAMFDDHNRPVKEAGPSTPVLLLGLNGAPMPGDAFNVMTDEREVKAIANRREQLQREQTRRTSPHITLDEIGRRIAIGDFKELNIIVKADVDGSVEALADSLLKLSTEEVQVNVIHKSVGAISESDVMLASASNAVIVGFNVRPTAQARKMAENEKIDIRLYSIIYTAIEEIKAAIEGMLAPEIEEVVTCNLEIRETFKISKVGTIAGCMVLDGKVTRNTKVRVIRDGIVIYTGVLGSLKRYKDDVKEVSAGMDCGLNIENFNDIKVGDIIEGYTEKEVARKL
ncbi:MAG: translation initiation factor IF-2 [bacterium F082]|nr:MAG: translation initiation factor IF-2 [bacterium F082]KWW30118.1 MAG: translation initiation factor IF-2 [bacterium P201]